MRGEKKCGRSKSNVLNRLLGKVTHHYGRKFMIGCNEIIHYQSKKTILAIRLAFSCANSINWHLYASKSWPLIWIWKPISICKKFGLHSSIRFCIALISWRIAIWTNWLCAQFIYLPVHEICQQNLKISWPHIVRNRKQRATFIVKFWERTTIVVTSLTFIIVSMCMIWRSLFYVWEHRTM